MDPVTLQRIAENESFFRDVNQRIERAAQSFDVEGLQNFLCECGDRGCTASIPLTLREYAQLRADPARFAVVPGHEIAEAERVIARNERFATIEKIGPARRVVVQRAAAAAARG